MILEICVGSLKDCVIAVENGADRLELNSALSLGGLTPSLGLVKLIRQKIDVPIIAMLRPRAGDFHYNDSEFETMLENAKELIVTGIEGIAFGILNFRNEIDIKRCAELISLSPNIEWVFHRAFDDIKDQFKALESLIDLGVNRILTSGGKETAMLSMKKIKELQKRAAGRIEILPGSGINSSNVQQLITKTGCFQIHGSFSKKKTTKQKSLFNVPLSEIDLVELKKVRIILDDL
jgi:copper homeostasis protein